MISRNTTGCVASGNAAASRIGAETLRQGGNAADSAIAAALALCVADPANISLFGRCQILVREPDGMLTAFNGASRIPLQTPPLNDPAAPRSGYGAAAFPGLPQTLKALHDRHGALSFAPLCEPAARLAEDGTEVGPQLTRIWRKFASEIASKPKAARYYAIAPTIFRHPPLAALLRAYGTDGIEGILTRERIEAVRFMGGYWSESDLEEPSSPVRETLTIPFRNWRIATIGRQGWGHTLAQMLGMLDRLPPFGKTVSPSEVRLLTAVILQALEDRPQQVGTLVPKTQGPDYDTLLEPGFLARRAKELSGLAENEESWADYCGARLVTGPGLPDQDTTHLSVIDRQSMAVSLTASIGPHFGTRVADGCDGVLLANSYRMAHAPIRGAYDVTEMAPAIATGPAGQVLALGAAGSERIPGAIAQVLINLIDRGQSLKAAVTAPRVNVKDGRLRLHAHMPQPVFDCMSRASTAYEVNNTDPASHLGIVQAVIANPPQKTTGQADPAYDGTAVAE